MSYPDHFLRGIRQSKWIKDNRVNELAFMPDDKPKEPRPDGDWETSINWEDDDEALPFTQKQQNSQNGVVRVSKEKFDMRLSDIKDVKYERHEMPGNSYHGNLVFTQGMSRTERKLICATIALCIQGPILKNGR